MTSSTLKAYIASEAQEYGVNPALANCIVEHESQFQPGRIGDIGNRNGASYGLWQIEVKQHGDITVDEALNPATATQWALQKIASGSVAIWSTYSAKPYYCRAVPVFLTN